MRAACLFAAALWSGSAAAVGSDGSGPVAIEAAPSQNSVAIVPDGAPPASVVAAPVAPPLAAPPAAVAMHATVAPATVAAPMPTAAPQAPSVRAAPFNATPAQPSASAAPQAPAVQATQVAAPPQPPPSAAPANAAADSPAAPPPPAPPPAGPVPVVTHVTRSFRRADGSIATVTTTTATTIMPPPRDWASGIPTAPYAVHRQGSLWRVAPRNGGDAVLARLDLHEVGLEPQLADQVMAGQATLLVEGRLIRSRSRRMATLLATAVEGGMPDR